jgi:glutamate 5-kinase
MDAERRKALVGSARRVLVKVGSAVLTDDEGLDLGRMDDLAREVAWCRRQGREVVIVSSGAIAAGRRKMGLRGALPSIPAKQAAAAIGQGILMRSWEEALGRRRLAAAQVLLTADDLAHRHRYLNARHTLETLLGWGVVPVINENDTVMVDEIKFGDNDQLAALIAALVGADLVLVLSDVDALYDADPRERPDARRVPVVARVDAGLIEAAGRAPGEVGTGGMRSKLLAAKRCLAAGIPMMILPGCEDGALRRALAGEDLGTLFAGRKRRYAGKKLWLAQLPRPSGELVVDDGAARALREGGTSLLPVGLREVRGTFGAGAPVRCVDESGTLVGVGLVNYGSAELEKIRGCRTAGIEARLGYRHSDEVIHRDHFALADETPGR